MKKIIKQIKYVVVCLTIITATSCSEDYLENINKDQPSVGVIFENVESAEFAVIGLIGSMTNAVSRGTSAPDSGLRGTEIGGYPIQLIQMDHLGEDIPWFNDSANYRYKQAYTWELLNGADNALLEKSWVHAYEVIAQANQILDNIDNVSGSQTAKDNFKGQALTVRAFMYLHLVQLFGDRFEAGTNNSQLGPILYTSAVQVTQPRNTVGETYALINADLEMAIDLLTDERQSKYFINKAVAQGVMARAALVQEDWNTAITMADAVIAEFPLMSNADYLTGFNDVNNPEWLWGWPRERFNSNGSGFGHFWVNIGWNGASTNIRNNPKRILSTLYDEVEIISDTDIRLANFSKESPGDDRFVDVDENGDPLTAFTFRSYTRVPYHAFKFKATDFRRGNQQQGDTPAMRAAEMYLIKAEAQQRGDNGDGPAAATLLQLNANRDANAILSANTGQALLEEIWLYRRLELWGEGFRFKDLKRNNLPLDRTGANHSANAGQVMEVPAGDERWTYLLPEIETRLNPNL